MKYLNKSGANKFLSQCYELQQLDPSLQHVVLSCDGLMPVYCALNLEVLHQDLAFAAVVVFGFARLG